MGSRDVRDLVILLCSVMVVAALAAMILARLM
jgi:hypothetical protein